jgi:Spy/CpxP family protein refolding chaperone
MIGRTAATLAAFALTACATQAAPPPPSDPAQPPLHGVTSGKCDPANIQQFVGQQRTAELEQQMLSVSGAASVRWAPFGTAVTMEFSADRLTAFLDEANRINRISCS